MFAHRHDHETLVLTQTRTSGDEVTTDDVLLEAFERIDLTVDSSIVEDLRRFLEGSSRHEALRLQSSTGDPLKDLASRRGLSFADLYGTQVTALQLAVLITQLAERDDLTWAEGLGVASVDDDDLTPEAVVLIHDLKLIDDLLLKEERIPWIEDLYLAHHLADDDFEVLVVDLHTLQAVDVLDFVDDVFLDGRGALDLEDIGRRDSTIRERHTSVDRVTLLDEDLLRGRYEVLTLSAELGGDDDLTVTALEALTEGDDTIDFCYDSRIRWVTCFEELRDTRQTTGDVTSLAHRARDLSERLPDVNLGVVLLDDVSTYWEVVALEEVAVGILDMDTRYDVTVLRFGDDHFLQTRSFVRLDAVGRAFDEVIEDDLTRDFGDDEGIEGVEFEERLTLLDLFTFSEEELSTVRHLDRAEDDLRILIGDLQLGHTADDDIDGLATIFGSHFGDTQVIEGDDTIVLSSDTIARSDVRSYPPDVEGTERQLCTRLTDRLSSDDPDDLTLLDEDVRSEVTAVALSADTLLRLTGEYRADLDLLDGRCLDALSSSFADLFASVDEDFTRRRMDHIVYRDTTEDALIEGSYYFVVVVFLRELSSHETTERTTVFFGDDDILRDVYETTREVTSVSRLQSRIGKTLTSTVGRDEVLKHGETLLEVRENWVLNDLSTLATALLRLSHQTTDTGELTDLLLRTTSTRVHHHEDGVEALVVFAQVLH